MPVQIHAAIVELGTQKKRSYRLEELFLSLVINANAEAECMN